MFTYYLVWGKDFLGFDIWMMEKRGLEWREGKEQYPGGIGERFPLSERLLSRDEQHFAQELDKLVERLRE